MGAGVDHAVDQTGRGRKAAVQDWRTGRSGPPVRAREPKRPQSRVDEGQRFRFVIGGQDTYAAEVSIHKDVMRGSFAPDTKQNRGGSTDRPVMELTRRPCGAPSCQQVTMASPPASRAKASLK